MLLQFGEFAPDTADLNSGQLAEAINCLPYEAGYRPMPSLSELSDAIGSTVFGATLAVSQDATKTKYVFAGTTGKLWRLGASMTWEDVSQALTTYAATADDRWSFAQFGQYVIAVNPNDDPQYFDLDGGTTFVDLPGSPPRARLVSVWGDFAVLGCLTTNPVRVQWSGLNDIANWTPGTGNSDYQDFPDGGWVKGLPPTDPPIILQDSAIRRANFLPGSVAVFSFEKIADQIGSTSFYSSISRDRNVFFLADDGFYAISSAGGMTPIGQRKVNKYYLDNVDREWVELTLAAIDPFYPRVYWVWRATGASGAAYDRILIYDFAMGRWTEARVETQTVVPLSTPGYTLEDLDSFGSLDALPSSLDSRAWAGGAAAILGAIGPNGKFGFFDAVDMEATFTTCEYGPTDGSVREVQTVNPIVDPTSAYVSLGWRMSRGSARAWTGEVATSSATGISRVRKRARYHTIKLRIPADSGWTYCQGVDVGVIGAGRR
jgi:hypothetical protein